MRKQEACEVFLKFFLFFVLWSPLEFVMQSVHEDDGVDGCWVVKLIHSHHLLKSCTFIYLLYYFPDVLRLEQLLLFQLELRYVNWNILRFYRFAIIVSFDVLVLVILLLLFIHCLYHNVNLVSQCGVKFVKEIFIDLFSHFYFAIFVYFYVFEELINWQLLLAPTRFFFTRWDEFWILWIYTRFDCVGYHFIQGGDIMLRMLFSPANHEVLHLILGQLKIREHIVLDFLQMLYAWLLNFL